jgi:hypothetical protein
LRKRQQNWRRREVRPDLSLSPSLPPFTLFFCCCLSNPPLHFGQHDPNSCLTLLLLCVRPSVHRKGEAREHHVAQGERRVGGAREAPQGGITTHDLCASPTYHRLFTLTVCRSIPCIYISFQAPYKYFADIILVLSLREWLFLRCLSATRRETAQ